MATATADNRRFTREEYEELVEQGYFHPGERVELIDGILYEMPPQSSFHATAVLGTNEALRSVFSDGYHVRSQFPLALGLDSEPEPDIAVVPGHFKDYVRAHPTTAILIIEVADSSLMKDRKLKASLYARAEILEYWILNLVHWYLEVYQEPKDGVYTSHTILRAGDSVSPLSRPEVSIPVASLLPLK
jgi:Uma2 family endonuclease